MLITNSKLIGTPVLSIQADGVVASISEAIVNPDNLKIIAFRLSSPIISNSRANILDVNSIREYSGSSIVIDNIEEVIDPDSVIKIADILKLNFNLLGLKVETRKGSKLGKIIDYTMTADDFIIQQIIVKRPTLKSFIDPELTISRKEIVEVNDYKVIVKDEEKVIKERATHEDFIPNFVNPFRTHEPGFASTDAEQSKS